MNIMIMIMMMMMMMFSLQSTTALWEVSKTSPREKKRGAMVRDKCPTHE
jgi:hypothetical protein